MAALAPVRLLPSTKAWFWQDVEEVRGSHGWNGRVQEPPPKVAMGVANRRFQASRVANAVRPAVQIDLLRVDFQDFVQATGITAPCRRSLGEFLECFAVTLVRGVLRRLEFLASFRLLGGRDD